jgi:SAM-dependent methyltransferase
VAYRLHKLPMISDRAKMKLDLDLAWIFSRLAHEMSSQVFPPEQHPLRTNSVDFLRRHLRPEQTVLDLGCKYGVLARLIAPLVEEIVGVDHDAAALGVARRENSADNVSYIDADALEYLTSSKRRFDVLLLSHILEHIDDPDAFLARFAPFFRFVYIELPDFEADYFGHYRTALGSTLNYTDTDHVAEFDRDEIARIIGAAGLEVVDSEFRFGLQKFWCANPRCRQQM